MGFVLITRILNGNVPMRIGLVAPPFIAVPPKTYGGTELFLSQLAHGLHARGHQVTLYANGDSNVPCELKWRYRHAEWPLADHKAAQVKNTTHAAWAIREAARSVDVLHINDTVAIPYTTSIDLPVIHTLHHPLEPTLSELYMRHPSICYVAISEFQARHEPMPTIVVSYHGVVLADYVFRRDKQDYLAFLGRMAPCKGAHLAIEVARRTGLPLKLAGEIQPVFREYWERDVRPYIDGRHIQYVGEADRAAKNDLLSNASALLFPIQWDEPFGLVMIEAMACGTPVLALPGGSVPEIVRDGVSGWICQDVATMAERALAPSIPPESCRDWVAERFSCEQMVLRYLEIYKTAIETHPARVRRSPRPPALELGVKSERPLASDDERRVGA
jgi:glycosyltransferase involved in cell wall biosynthesis